MGRCQDQEAAVRRPKKDEIDSTLRDDSTLERVSTFWDDDLVIRDYDSTIPHNQRELFANALFRFSYHGFETHVAKVKPVFIVHHDKSTASRSAIPKEWRSDVFTSPRGILSTFP
jgi:hypothetical protein